MSARLKADTLTWVRWKTDVLTQDEMPPEIWRAVAYVSNTW
jgi:hypothetical protein